MEQSLLTDEDIKYLDELQVRRMSSNLSQLQIFHWHQKSNLWIEI